MIKQQLGKSLEMAKVLQCKMDLAFEKSDLPESPNMEFIIRLTFELRERFYQN
jgi:hypothetical protein